MPTYEYRCEKGHTFEVFQRMTDDPITICQVCGKPVQRIFHPPAVHFKGKGFYNTDYGTRNRQRELAAAGDGSSKDSKSDAGKSDSKSDSGGGSETTKKGTAETPSSSSSSSPSEKKSDKPKADKKSKPASKPA